MIDSDLRKLQQYIWQKNIERGFSEETPERKMLMLTEEVGELAKAIRQHVGMGFSETTARSETSDELADVLIILLGLASTLGIDLYDSVATKEAKNARRTWS